MDDPRWEEALTKLSDDELIAYLKQVHDVISADREAFSFVPDELLNALKDDREGFVQKVRRAKIAEQEAAASKAALDRPADDILASLDDHGKKGN